MGVNNIKPKNMALRVERFDYRLIFSKTGRARFISHLDIMRTFSRIFKRAKLPVWYTQGFNPRLYIMFPLALPLGTESRVEVMDISLTEPLEKNEIIERVNAVMPEGMRIERITDPVMDHKEIAASEYEIRFSLEGDHDTFSLFEQYLSQPAVIVKKRSKKKGDVEIDIKPDVKLLSLDREGDMVRCTLILPSGNDKNINTSVLIDGFKEFAGAPIKQIYTTRTKILTKSGEIFT